jgi:transcriptional regulator with XRE-family HTH domain
MNLVMTGFGEWVRLRRVKLGLTQAALAKRLQTNQPGISRIENGLDNLTVPEVEAIGRALEDVDGALEAARTPHTVVLRETVAGYGAPTFDEDELELLQAYRGLERPDRARAKMIIDMLKTAVPVTGDESRDELHSRKDGA